MWKLLKRLFGFGEPPPQFTFEPRQGSWPKPQALPGTSYVPVHRYKVSAPNALSAADALRRAPGAPKLGELRTFRCESIEVRQVGPSSFVVDCEWIPVPNLLTLGHKS